LALPSDEILSANDRVEEFFFHQEQSLISGPGILAATVINSNRHGTKRSAE
jgi:hypothetical protein